MSPKLPEVLLSMALMSLVWVAPAILFPREPEWQLWCWSINPRSRDRGLGPCKRGWKTPRVLWAMEGIWIWRWGEGEYKDNRLIVSAAGPINSKTTLVLVDKWAEDERERETGRERQKQEPDSYWTWNFLVFRAIPSQGPAASLLLGKPSCLPPNYPIGSSIGSWEYVYILESEAFLEFTYCVLLSAPRHCQYSLGLDISMYGCLYRRVFIYSLVYLLLHTWNNTRSKNSDLVNKKKTHLLEMYRNRNVVPPILPSCKSPYNLLSPNLLVCNSFVGMTMKMMK